ncbi:MAG TPA: HNH endonuclease signature motif containing protein [Streptomyces sp.]|nr:HNH endonuclease signature motif containing protein [Streptomyces sp.]
MLRRMGQPLSSSSLHYLRKRIAHYGIDTSGFVDEPLPGRPRISHTKTVLEEAAASSSSLKEMVEYLGIQPYSSIFGYLRRRLTHFGIDTSHFTAPHSGRGAVIGRQALQAAVAESSSLAAFIRILELPLTSASRNRVRKAIGEYGIPTAHFTGQGHNRNRPAPNRRTADEILQRLDQGASRTKRSLLHRALQEKGVAYICGECGVGSLWHGRRLVLEIGHINGDRLDNRIGNLRYLCPSCHSQTCTFSNRSRA